MSIAWRNATSLLAISVLSVIAQTVHAQEVQNPAAQTAMTRGETLQDIVVTANRRIQDVQDVPVAVTAFSQESLSRLQVSDVFDLNRTVPNLIITEVGGASTSPGIVIRGIGLIDATWNAESGVGLYMDDVYVPGQIMTSFDLLDIERIEVLRGPQGTLYGRNSTSGAVKIIMRRPDINSFQLKTDLTVGSRDRFDARGSVSVPLVSDTLAVKLDAVYKSQDGQVFNRTTGKDANYLERIILRGAMLWKPSDTFEAYLVGGYTRENSGISLSTPTRYDYATGQHIPVFGYNIGESGIGVRDINDADAYDASLQLSLETGLGTVKSITAYRDVKSILSGDLDGLFIGDPLPFGSGFINVDFDQVYRDKLFTQELQLHNRLWDKLDFILGLYYFDRKTHQDTWTKLFFPTGMRQVAGQKAKSYAAFADLTYDISDKFQMFGGLRWTTERKIVDHQGAIATVIGIATPFVLAPFPGTTLFNFNDVTDRWSQVTTRIGARYEFTDDIMMYASRSDGFKPGQLMTARGPDPIGSGAYSGKETSTTYEAGLRTKLFDKRLLFNVTGYYQIYKDLQTGSLTNGNVTTTTADVKIHGFEVESTFVTPLEGLIFNGSIGYNKGKFKIPGLVMKDAPEFNAQIGFSYENDITDEWTLGIGSSYFWQSGVYFGNVVKSDARYQEGYGLVDGQVYVKGPLDRWRVTLGVKNIFDRRFAFLGNEFIGLPPALEPMPFANRYYNAGRQWSLSLRFNY